MPNKFLITLLVCLLMLSFPSVAKAETVIEKVVRTGYFNAGFHFDMIPYSYVDAEQQLVGYSVDMIDLIKAELEKEVGKPIELLTQPVTIDTEKGTSDLITKIENHEVDITCNVGFTWERARFVDFSTSNSISGLKLLIKQGSNLGTPESLAGKRIAIAPDSPAAVILPYFQPQVILVKNFGSVKESIAALDQGDIDAIAGDSLILDGTRQAQSNPDGYKLVPDSPYARYGLGCIVPQDNSSFRRLVDKTIIGVMQGYLNGESSSVEMIDRWFGIDGLTPIAPELIRSFFAFQIQTHAQVPPRDEILSNPVP